MYSVSAQSLVSAVYYGARNFHSTNFRINHSQIFNYFRLHLHALVFATSSYIDAVQQCC